MPTFCRGSLWSARACSRFAAADDLPRRSSWRRCTDSKSGSPSQTVLLKVNNPPHSKNVGMPTFPFWSRTRGIPVGSRAQRSCRSGLRGLRGFVAASRIVEGKNTASIRRDCPREGKASPLEGVSYKCRHDILYCNSTGKHVPIRGSQILLTSISAGEYYRTHFPARDRFSL
jgi:hypothetical protein